MNGDYKEACVGNKIVVIINGKTKDGSKKVCYSQEANQIRAGSTHIWTAQNLGRRCRTILYDLNHKIEVQVQTTANHGFCPKKVELEVLDLDTNKPRYFCSTMQDKDYFESDKGKLHDAKEERCFLNHPISN